MAGHHSNWIKVPGSPKGASAKGNVFVSNAAMMDAGIVSKAELRLLPPDMILKLATTSTQPGGQAQAGEKGSQLGLDTSAPATPATKPLPKLVKDQLTKGEQAKAQQQATRSPKQLEREIRDLLGLSALSPQQRRQLLILGGALILSAGAVGAVPAVAGAALAAGGIAAASAIARAG